MRERKKYTPRFNLADWENRVTEAAISCYLDAKTRNSLQAQALAAGVDRVQVLRTLYEAGETQAKILLEQDARAKYDGLILPANADGLAVGLEAAEWSLRYNTTADRIECRYGGPLDAAVSALPADWTPCEGIVRDLMLDAVSCAVSVMIGERVEPWHVRSKRQEDRLLAVVANRHAAEGEGSMVYQAVREHLHALNGVGFTTVAEVVTRAGVVQAYEVGARVPRPVMRDAVRALQDAGWSRRSVRIDGEPVKRWTGPAGTARRRVPLLTAIRGGQM